ncbi:MAG: hemolysin family protein [Bacteroidales bacterium]|nr:hemolysin family protein [Bacteroidales bacterium]
MEILIILLLILFNGFLTFLKYALLSTRKSKLETYSQKIAKKTLSLIDNPENFIGSIQIGITFITLFIGIYSVNSLIIYLKNIFLDVPSLYAYAGILAISIIIILLTYVSLVLGELLPKNIALLFPEKISYKFSGFMIFFSKLFFPLHWIFTKTGFLIMRIFSLKKLDDNKITEEEILAAIEQGTSDGEIQEVEQDIVERVFDLGDRDVESLMTYRNEIIFLDINDSIEKINTIIYNYMHSYYPVIDGNIDKLLGVVYLRDLFNCVSKDHYDLKKYIHPPQYIPETTSAYNVLKLFKESKIYYAFIIDEFGSLQGMITAVDIMEALVGKIGHLQENEETIIQKEDNAWITDGQYPFYDFLSHFDMEDLFPDNDYNTLSGLILEITEHIPQVREKLQWKKFEFEILEMDGARIDKVLVNIVQNENIE